MCIYHGKKYGEEKLKAYQQADIFVFPTFFETFGLVNLEAMAHGKPIVSTNEGCVPDVVIDGKNGLIAERKDPQSLARCIELLLNDNKKCQIMGENGYRMFKEKYTLDVFEQRMADILYDALSLKSLKKNKRLIRKREDSANKCNCGS